MKRSVLLTLGLLASLSAHAQIYQYKDASGKTVFTDQAPVGGATKARTIAGEAPADTGAAAQKSAADRELAFRKRQAEQREAAEKAQKESATKSAVAEECNRTRNHLQTLESGERIASRDDKGERVYMEDDQRAAEINRLRKYLADTCK